MLPGALHVTLQNLSREHASINERLSCTDPRLYRREQFIYSCE